MNRVKTFAKYALWIILFWIFSDILIYYGINSTYKKINSKNELPSSITVTRAEATKVNGRINGTIFNSENADLSGKYIKIDLYSSLGNLLGTDYLEIGTLRPNETKSFETYFKIQDVATYDISISDQKEETVSEDLFIPEDLSEAGILLLLTYMLFF